MLRGLLSSLWCTSNWYSLPQGWFRNPSGGRRLMDTSSCCCSTACCRAEHNALCTRPVALLGSHRSWSWLHLWGHLHGLAACGSAARLPASATATPCCTEGPWLLRGSACGVMAPQAPTHPHPPVDAALDCGSALLAVTPKKRCRQALVICSSLLRTYTFWHSVGSRCANRRTTRYGVPGYQSLMACSDGDCR